MLNERLKIHFKRNGLDKSLADQIMLLGTFLSPMSVRKRHLLYKYWIISNDVVSEQLRIVRKRKLIYLLSTHNLRFVSLLPLFSKFKSIW